MTYEVGNTILTTEQNTFVGVPTGTPTNVNKALHPFVNAAEATDTVAGIAGIGFGDRGYGETAETLSNKSPGDLVASAEWTGLRESVFVAASHQGTATTLLPPAAEHNAGQLIEAHESSSPTLDTFDYDTMISNIDTNRLNTDSGSSLSLDASEHSVTRGTAWGASPALINATFTATFSDEDAARFFFNSGGEIQMVFTHPGGASAQDIEWRAIFVGVGTIAFRANVITRSGALGTIQGPAGYYGLSTSSAKFYNGNDIGTGAYTTNDVNVYARYAAGNTTNGAKGSAIQFLVEFNDQHTGTQDVCASGTKIQVAVNWAKSTGGGGSSALDNIEKPTWGTSDGL